jgi:cytochrome c1
VLFALLLLPAGLAGWAVGHYTSLGKPSKTVVHTVTASPSSTLSSSTSISSTTTTAPATTTSSGGGGNVAAGKAVFASQGCASCHTFKPANASGTIGPDLDSAPHDDAQADGNMDLRAFIKESITDPDAYVAKGFSKGLMPGDFESKLSAAQLNDLVAFILSGTKE